jgi:hypothetical protein
MGRLTYDSTLAIDFEDRTLAHLHLVIGAKLRRSEAFFFGLKDDVAAGDGRLTIWIHPTIPLAFKFFGGRPPRINRAWVDLMMLSANSPQGLQLVPEPEPYNHHDSTEVHE